MAAPAGNLAALVAAGALPDVVAAALHQQQRPSGVAEANAAPPQTLHAKHAAFVPRPPLRPLSGPLAPPLAPPVPTPLGSVRPPVDCTGPVTGPAGLAVLPQPSAPVAPILLASTHQGVVNPAATGIVPFVQLVAQQQQQQHAPPRPPPLPQQQPPVVAADVEPVAGSNAALAAAAAATASAALMMSVVNAEGAQVPADLQTHLLVAQRLPCVVPQAFTMRAEADARVNLAASMLNSGSDDIALYHYQVALWLNPESQHAFLGLAAVLARKGDVTWAQCCYAEVLRLNPLSDEAWCGIALLQASAGNQAQAIAFYQEAIRVNPACHKAFCALGHLFKVGGRLDEALSCYRAAARLQPECARTLGFLAAVFFEQGNMSAAVNMYQEAIRHEPNFPEAYNDLGNALRGLSHLKEAVQCYMHCLQLHRELSGGHYTQARTHSVCISYNNLASALKMLGQNDECIACYEYVAQLKPESAEVHANLGSAYKDASRHEEAIASYQRALALRPNFPVALAYIVHSLQCVCDWRDRDRTFEMLSADIRRQLAEGQSFVQPFHAMAYPLDSDLVLALTREHARHVSLSAARLGVKPFVHPAPGPATPERRLRLGYVSSDFGNHPLSHLMGSVFGGHDRSRIEVFCYALSPSDGTPYRQRTETEVEHFVDVNAWTVPQIAQRIFEDGIQILVDLNGYTKGARNELFALRPAPIQVSYMGFPATTGAEFIDYLVTDRVTAPPSLKRCYSEALVRMPHSYFVNDYRASHPDVLDPSTLPMRADFGLPDDKFIFSCSNQLYKFDPATMDTWCNILRRVPNSVLWLLRFPPYGEPRIYLEAESRGVDRSRIIFTDVAPKDVHIKRSALADLFLDTPMCNAHTTGCDTLWAGTPMVTLPLERMASRVAASLCCAIGCPEMVVSSQSEYEELAVNLALNPPKLRALREKVARNRLTEPLFDTPKWIRDFDRLVLKVWEKHVVGEAPHDFDA